ncbi:MAG: hypothetical protein EWV85_19195 [Microcystis aeruginosa Ma_QC_C_20070703_M131]|uniref:Uncharacterized protein n=1 Tax=Microcystis aeruginosa Ma_QC_C_20070703_M131 TaxID=2486263 RepID=A0A551XAC8_MICAE|nr:MAG: hypothetical protein EWV85_19195 [Microcystis aeruginosa Ma_QC_C_20070703_M131]
MPVWRRTLFSSKKTPPTSLIRSRIPLIFIRGNNRPLPNIISRPKVFLVKKSTRIKIILIASYFFSGIELATIDTHSSHRTIWVVHKPQASCDWVIIFGDV